MNLSQSGGACLKVGHRNFEAEVDLDRDTDEPEHGQHDRKRRRDTETTIEPQAERGQDERAEYQLKTAMALPEHAVCKFAFLRNVHRCHLGEGAKTGRVASRVDPQRDSIDALVNRCAI